MVLSGPSGVGKTSLARQVLTQVDGLFSISVTTRPRSPQEADGVDYHFIDDASFLEMVQSDALLEHAEVFGKHRYGTPRAPVEAEITAGRIVILDIDVQGFDLIRNSINDGISIFIIPPSIMELEKRLISRGLDSDDVIRKRLKNGK